MLSVCPVGFCLVRVFPEMKQPVVFAWARYEIRESFQAHTFEFASRRMDRKSWQQLLQVAACLSDSAFS